MPLIPYCQTYEWLLSEFRFESMVKMLNISKNERCSKPKVLILTAFYLPGFKGGGPIKTIKNLVEQTSHQIEFKLITSDRDLGDENPYGTEYSNQWKNIEGTEVFYLSPDLFGLFHLLKCIKDTDFDVINLNSFFSIRFSLLPLILSLVLRKKIILGPRGEFSERALQLKKNKKRLFIKLYRALGLHKKAIYQASSVYEEQDIRAVLGKNIDVFVAEDIGAREFSDYIERESSDRLRLVFVSRISPKKNISFALDGLKFVDAKVDYDIYGPIEDDKYWSKCLEKIKELPQNVKVEYKGMLSPDTVISTMSYYDMFYMPTMGENYGHVIAEALCAGLPLLISNETPWKNLKQDNLGWDLGLQNPKDYADVINDFSMLPAEQKRNFRQNILTWAMNRFSQDEAVSANITMFNYAIKK